MNMGMNIPYKKYQELMAKESRSNLMLNHGFVNYIIVMGPQHLLKHGINDLRSFMFLEINDMHNDKMDKFVDKIESIVDNHSMSIANIYKSILVIGMNKTYSIFVNHDTLYSYFFTQQHDMYDTIEAIVNNDKKTCLLNIENKDPIISSLASAHITDCWKIERIGV